jgi:CRISPR-associated endonuclease/helicase Cas3
MRLLDRLAAGRPCRLISTQLIEAGVDVDFPVVYRALAGLDSIAQSAGRCDREGKLTDAAGTPAGRMTVFRAETDPPPGVPVKAMQSTEVLAALGDLDPFDPRHCERFFAELYGKTDPDARRVQPLRRALAFAAVADAFKLMDEDTHPVVVPYIGNGIDGPARIAAFRASPSRDTARALQPLVVQVRRYLMPQLRASITAPADKDEFEQFDFLLEGHGRAYDDRFGLDTSGHPDASDLIA